jgi:amino acid adenylation domain-containing protein
MQATFSCGQSKVKSRRPAESSEFARIDIDTSIPEQFSQQVGRRGSGCAVRTTQDSWSYSQLDERATTIAGALWKVRENGQRRVALLYEHGAPMVAAILGALRAGAAYVPLDPLLPTQRLHDLREDAAVSTCVTDDAHVAHARSLGFASARIFSQDELCRRPTLTSGPRHDMVEEYHRLIKPDDLAYILYTTGSTGAPKGVTQTHRNVLIHIRNYSRALQVALTDRLSLLSRYSFDAAVMDIFGALLNGARLCPFDLRNGGLIGLPTWLHRNRITIYHSTPTVYRDLVARFQDGRAAPYLRFVVVGGEEARRTDFDAYRRCFSLQTKFVNGYGPTESSLAMQFIGTHRTTLSRSSIPLGKPVDGIDVSLVKHGHLVRKAGEVGEIVLTGRQITPGYWRRSRFNASVFATSSDTTMRTYHTRDLGRLLPDGGIEFAGRLDRVAKINGYGVELDTIEARLLEHPAISQAAVIVTNTPRPVLEAFIVPRRGHQLTPRSIRTELFVDVPEHILPARVDILGVLPLTPNGKVDRSALATLARDHRYRSLGRLPRTQVEARLHAIWTRVLGRPLRSIDEDFFTSGADSLHVAQVVCLIEEVFGVRLAFSTPFEQPTIATLAVAIEQAGTDGLMEPKHELSPPLRHAVPLSAAQARYWKRISERTAPSAFHVATAYWIRGPLNLRLLERSLIVVTARHEALRLSFTTTAGNADQVVSDDVKPRVRIVDLRCLSPRVQAQRLRRESAFQSSHPFNLTRAPLMRTTVFRLGPQRHLLLSVTHHLITDARSREVFERDLEAVYSALLRGKTEAPLPEAGKYSAFARWQRFTFPGTPEHSSQLAYWRTVLVNVERAIPKLPAHRISDKSNSSESRAQTSWLDAGLSGDVIALAQSEGVSRFILLLAAFKTLLFSYSRQRDIVITTDSANRHRPEWANTYGLFTNVLPLRTKLQPGLPFRELVRRVRFTTLAAYAHQDIPFAQVLDALLPSRLATYETLFPAAFFVERGPGKSRPPGILSHRCEIDHRTISRDLILAVTEVGNKLGVTMRYRKALFRSWTIEGMLNRYRAILGAAVTAPSTSLDKLARICVTQFP